LILRGRDGTRRLLALSSACRRYSRQGVADLTGEEADGVDLDLACFVLQVFEIQQRGQLTFFPYAPGVRETQAGSQVSVDRSTADSGRGNTRETRWYG
jgi:hypothetical protein